MIALINMIAYVSTDMKYDSTENKLLWDNRAQISLKM